MMNDYEIIVVGGGHAGIEAASSAARMGVRTALITMDINKIGLMSCNPAIGGLAKGQLVREIDALGGEMAKITDLSGIHFKMLNKSKGPAVWSPRAQTDRLYYSVVARQRLEKLKNLELIDGSVVKIVISKNRARGVVLDSGKEISCKSVIMTTGTFLNGIIHIGLNKMKSGRAGDKPAAGITESLTDLGFSAGRLKTGTPPRLHRDSIDFTALEEQKPDDPPEPFSFSTERIDREQVSCFIAYTNGKTHEALRKGFDQSPMFTGRIKAIGPRYCPSIEDKINRFADKPRHQLFLEPEGYDNPEIYLNGFSTSLPENVQRKAVKTVKGLEKAEIIRLGYAVEYDFFYPHQLKFTMETKRIHGLYFAGQINGTSGYEEAAAQGLIAGINASLQILEAPQIKISRSEAYIGVLLDDLINKSTLEPYRMFTSHAEFRLLLRQDNADLRLSHYNKRTGLLSPEEEQRVSAKKEHIKQLQERVKKIRLKPSEFEKLYGNKSSSLSQPDYLSNLIKRPEVRLKTWLESVYKNHYKKDVIQEVEFNIKYEGYIRRNEELLNRFKEQESRKIPPDTDYFIMKGLSAEAVEKLNKIKPESFGQATRISGISQADLSVLLIYLERERYKKSVSRETSG